MSNFSIDILSKKSKAELIELAMQHNIPAYKKLNKSELIDALFAIGQEKRESSKDEQKSFWSKYHNHVYGITSIIGLALAILAFLPNLTSNQNSQLIPSEILDQRVAVVPFENRTGDSTLHLLGEMSADWINHGLMDLEHIEVVSPFTIRANAKFLGTPQFAEQTKAQNIITGNYYKNDDELTFKLELADALNGKVKIAFDDITGPVTDQKGLVTKLREKISGYWRAKVLVDDRRIHTPDLAAYELYQKALRNPSTLASKGAADKDTTFYLAAIEYLNTNRVGYRADTPEYFDRLDRHYENLTLYERKWFDGLKALYYGDCRAAYFHLNSLRLKYPYDYWLNHETAGLAADCLNNPEMVLEIQNELPLNKSSQAVMGEYYNYRINHTVNALIKQNKLSELKSLLKMHPPSEDVNRALYYAIEYGAALAMNDPNSTKILDEAIVSYESYFIVMGMYHSRVPKADRLKLENQKNEWSELDNGPYPVPFSTLDDTDDMSQTISDLEIDLTKYNVYNYTDLLYVAAKKAIDRQDEKGIQAIIDKLTILSQTDTRVGVSIWSRAFALYHIGVIHAQMDQQTEAMDYLRKARDKGLFTVGYPYDKDIRLASLYDKPEFQELIKPIRPKVKG